MLEFVAAILLISFWAAVVSFIPIVFYLLIKNPPIYHIDNIRSRGIYILQEENFLQKNLRSRKRLVVLIYLGSFVFVALIFLNNYFRLARAGVWPIDILSAAAIALFGFSILTYVPVAIYVFLRVPAENREGGLCVTRYFMGYGLAILVFSVFFVRQWLIEQGLWVRAGDAAFTLGTLLLGGGALAYLPVLAYVFGLRAFKPQRFRAVHPNVIFLIYSICFLLFAAVYFFSWYAQWNQGQTTRLWY